MANNCPWCGKALEKRYIQQGDKIREVCARCGYKLREYKKPEQPVKQEEPKVLEIRETEKPIVQEKPIWPWIIGGLVILLLIIIIVKSFLL
jgi:uncharacterized membrane protein YvbJ